MSMGLAVGIAVLVTLVIAIPLTAVLAITYRKKVVEGKFYLMPSVANKLFVQVVIIALKHQFIILKMKKLH